MADSSKAQKLKSSKKRYKELLEEQKKKKGNLGNNGIDGPGSREQTPPSLTSSTHSSVNTELQPQQDNTATSPLSHYFNQTNYENNSQIVPPAVFFDNFIVSNEPVTGENESNIVDSVVMNNESNSDNSHLVISESDTRNLVEYLHQDGPEIQQQSNIESLKQLSQQMAELIEPNLEFSSNSITDLEKRNLELAAQLEQEKIHCQQLEATINSYQKKIEELETELSQNIHNSDLALNNEVIRLKEELQCHIQTVGLLVAEKTELSANLNQLELKTKQKSTECEELQARLKASRSRVAELERELSSFKSDKSRNEHLEREHLENLERLKSDYEQLKYLNEEITQDLLETREKLKQTSESNINLQQQIQDLSGKLSLANVKIQQLTSGGNSEVEGGKIEQLTQEKFGLEKEIANLNQTLKSITKERDEFSTQYQQYAQQLNSQLTNLWSKIEQLQSENETLVTQEQNRIKHIGELERQLQNLQTEHINYSSVPKSDNGDGLKYEKERELCAQLQMQKSTLEEEHVKLCNEKELLVKELNAKNDSISQMESLIEQLRGNQPDSVKLLATMESDKVAAARAMAQNKELKEQMEGMQEVFLKLNNDKVELTEKLAIEQRSNKELIEKLQKTEISWQTLADAIEIKDRELSHLRDSTEELSKKVLQHDQLNDRLRHYEAQDHSSHSLQSELQEAKQLIVKLTNQINHEDEISTQLVEELQIKDDNHNDEMTMLDREIAMKHLEDKVKRTMQDIADLSEEKQRLEHLVLQLQGETETIGEYVALYQHQRSVLKQRALEKDHQLKQLANDREQMKMKLQKLNDLIRKLVNEKHDDRKLDVDDEQLLKGLNGSVDTAEEIIELLSEIKTSNLVEPDENVHHCPWCSGQLITV